MSKLIAIMTTAPKGTLGDVSGTLKLLRNLRQAFSETTQPRITWYLYVENLDQNRDRYNHFIIFAKSLEVDTHLYEMHTRYGNMRLKTIEDFTIKPDLLIFYSSFGELWPERHLAKSLGILALYAPEYDSGFCYGKEVIATGLGDHMRGIFFEQETTIESVGELNGTDKKLAFDLNLLANPQTSYLSETLIQQFKDNSLLYVAYFNQSTRVFNKHVNFKHYFLIAMSLALDTGRKEINIVANTCDISIITEILACNPNLFKAFKSLTFISNTGHSVIDLNNVPSLPTIRVYSYSTLGPKLFYFLLSISEKFKAVTGNESLSEGIVTNGILFYQVMKWRLRLAKGLQARCDEYCGADSILSQYYKIILDPKHLGFDVLEVALFIKANIKELEQQSKALREGLLSHNNLATNLGRDLALLLSEPNRMHELFPECRENKVFTPKTEHAYFMARYPNVATVETSNIRDKAIIDDSSPGKEIILSDAEATQILAYANSCDPASKDVIFEFEADFITPLNGYYSFKFPYSQYDADDDDTVVHVRKHIKDSQIYTSQKTAIINEDRPRFKKLKLDF